MAKQKRKDVVGYASIKNKVHRNAFDLSHRHLFTASVGELLPVFVQWVNPNETFKLSFDSFTRTKPLNTAAFARLKQNVQYFFVPFQQLWKYFEANVNNMPVGDNGQNVSRFASSLNTPMGLSSDMPYLSLVNIWLYVNNLLDATCNALVNYMNSKYSSSSRDFSGYDYNEAITYLEGYKLAVHKSLRYARVCKLLRALGYGDFVFDTYDMISKIFVYGNAQTTQITADGFRYSDYGYELLSTSLFKNVPNVSVFPLLAYHKIVNDFYRYRQWQEYRSYDCNIDYLDSDDVADFDNDFPFDDFISLFDLEQNNLPLDYLNGVLPSAQYGDDSAASLDFDSSISSDSRTANVTGYKGTSSYTDLYSGYTNFARAGQVYNSANGGLTLGSGGDGIGIAMPNHTHDLTGTSFNGSASLKISALRSAIALQRYKEIQNANDPDYADQVLAHYGIRPKNSDYKSHYLFGGDNVLAINEVVNTNLTGNNTSQIKATSDGSIKCSGKFSSDTFGIIIGIYSCTPQLDYAHGGLDRNLLKTDATDFPIPELDNIGMQTQYRFEIYSEPLVNTQSNIESASASYDLSRTYGYNSRYAEYKTSYDRFEGAFLNSLKSWVTGLDLSVLRKWSISVSDRTVDSLYPCEPDIVDNIFVDNTHGTADSDQILVASVNGCVAVRPFSIHGLPYSS